MSWISADSDPWCFLATITMEISNSNSLWISTASLSPHSYARSKNRHLLVSHLAINKSRHLYLALRNGLLVREQIFISLLWLTSTVTDSFHYKRHLACGIHWAANFHSFIHCVIRLLISSVQSTMRWVYMLLCLLSLLLLLGAGVLDHGFCAFRINDLLCEYAGQQEPDYNLDLACHTL